MACAGVSRVDFHRRNAGVTRIRRVDGMRQTGITGRRTRFAMQMCILLTFLYVKHFYSGGSGTDIVDGTVTDRWSYI